MSATRLRFIHADQLHLDAQPDFDGKLGDQERHLLQDATLNAFEEFVSNAVEQNVHFVLLTGRLFAPEGPTLRSLVALRDGLNVLEDARIEAIVLPEADELETLRNTTWLASNNLNDLSPWDRHPATVQCRDDHVVSVSTLRSSHDGIRRVDPPESREQMTRSVSTSTFRLGVMYADPQSSLLEIDESLAHTFDYVAVSGPIEHRHFHASESSAMAPGVLQPIGDLAAERSCALLTKTDAHGHLSSEELVLRSVGLSRLRVTVPEDADWEDLVQQMQSRLRALGIPRAERLHIIEWEIHAGGGLLRSLRENEFRDEIVQFLDEERQDRGRAKIHHEMVLPDSAALMARVFGTPETELEHDYLELMATTSVDVLQQRTDERLRSLARRLHVDDDMLSHLDRTHLAEQAQHIGRQCLQDAAHDDHS